MSKELEKLADLVYKCIRCGACRSVCPTFGEELSETVVARGRMALVEAVIDGRLDMGEAFENTIFGCAMCGACKANCPAGVDVPKVIEEARAVLAKEKGSQSLARYLARRSLKDKKAMDGAFAMMALGRAFYAPLAATPLAKFLPYQYKDMKRNLPKMPKRPLPKRVPEHSTVDNAKGRVVFYAGCVVNYVYPEIGETAVHVLNAAGYDVRIIRDELCCGKPLSSLGEMDAYRKLAEQVVAQLEVSEADAVLTACPTCALTLKEDYPKILPDSKGAAALSDKVEDVNRFLTKNTDILKGIEPIASTVTYHDPCHLNFGMGIKAEPREILKAATGGLVEMAGAEKCCGFGGSFSFLNYALSGRIASKKSGAAIATGADIVATACPGCMMHMRDGLKQAGGKQEVLHTLQIIEKALKK
ncbi:MAG: (Fe-S)-binding protein [Nitrospirae bacterium]|nr:(Fe-S)-binding protein [Nitrospirota bacterium]